MAKLTLLDVAKLNGNDTVVGLIEENLTYVPELRYFPVRQISGTSYTTVKRTGFPSVSFRSANEGVTPTKSTFAKQLVECYILSSRVEVDRAVLQAQASDAPALEMLEASGVMRQALITLASQIWYGVSVDTKGFPGIKAATAFGGATTYNSGGSNATQQTSVYGVKFGTQDVTLITGNGASFDLGEFRDETIYDSDSKALPGRVSDLVAWVGLQVGNINSVGRMANVGNDGETGDMLTDAKIAAFLRLFPVGYMPDALFCNRRSLAQLQTSRTIVITSGPGAAKAAGNVESVAPLPVLQPPM